MATITIRNLDETVKRKLHVRAALNGRSMEAEAREMITGLVTKGPAVPRGGLGTLIHKRFAAIGGVDLQIPPRKFSSRPANGLTEDPAKSDGPREGLGTAIHKLFAPLGGVELQIPTRRKSHRPIPAFD
jgi:plasmid stability protein